MIHLEGVTFDHERYPTHDHYPFNLDIFRGTSRLAFSSPVTFFVGENGSGKSTLLRALSYRCGIHIWMGTSRRRFEVNPYEEALHQALSVQWTNGTVPGSFFGSDIFRSFAQILDEWASASPKVLDYFGGHSLLTQSHGQSLLSFFKARYRIEGLYLLDEPETALSPRSQLELLRLVAQMTRAGHAQFIIATHSPILLACPDAQILSFDHIPVKPIRYRDTEHYRFFRGFMADPEGYLRQGGTPGPDPQCGQEP